MSCGCERCRAAQIIRHWSYDGSGPAPPREAVWHVDAPEGGVSDLPPDRNIERLWLTVLKFLDSEASVEN